MSDSNPIDIYVGKRLRLRRTILGLSQENLADSLGITFQQVQKYEKGINRISASRLFEIAKTLSAPVSFFFEEYGEVNPIMGFAEDADSYEAEDEKNKESISLLRAYYKIKDPKIRKKALELIKSLADDK